MENEVIIEYTEKEYKGIKSAFFESKEDAKNWLKENEDKIYWHNMRLSNSASSKPKILVEEEPSLDEYEKVEGVLQTYFETGMESLGLILQDMTKTDGLNPNFDPTKPESPSNFKYFLSYAGLYMLMDGDILQIENGPKHLLLKDTGFAIDDGFKLSFYPQGFSRKELLDLFSPNTVKATLWRSKTVR